jgi:3-hydroxyacyl-CoA dehydrogenase
MTYDQRLQNVSVLGAAGKMGSGILLLTAIEMTDLSLKSENKGKLFVLNAVDISQEMLAGLMKYIKAQTLKIAEKKMVWLRQAYADRKDLIENGEIVNEYISDVVSIIRPTTNIEAAYHSTLIFEAASENQELKRKLFTQIDENSLYKPWFFTNTSSIPIKVLNKEANLGGRILGYHFYNPPAVQKLVELITITENSCEMIDFAENFAKSLKKVVVPSNDYAGFIGNGHFMRDALHGISEVGSLMKRFSFVESVYMINKVTQDFLVRPLGIFQLIDYVGIDVVRFIMNVMNPYYKDEDIHSVLLDELFEMGVKGGQNTDGSQKDGFLKYEKSKPVAIFDPERNKYMTIAELTEKCDAALGLMPTSFAPWKSVNSNKNKDAILQAYFNELNGMNTLGSGLAKKYNTRSNEIGRQLVSSGVAHNDDDVNKVMLTGFFHAYGPINNYLK